MHIRIGAQLFCRTPTYKDFPIDIREWMDYHQKIVRTSKEHGRLGILQQQLTQIA